MRQDRALLSAPTGDDAALNEHELYVAPEPFCVLRVPSVVVCVAFVLPFIRFVVLCLALWACGVAHTHAVGLLHLVATPRSIAVSFRLTRKQLLTNLLHAIRGESLEDFSQASAGAAAEEEEVATAGASTTDDQDGSATAVEAAVGVDGFVAPAEHVTDRVRTGRCYRRKPPPPPPFFSVVVVHRGTCCFVSLCPSVIMVCYLLRACHRCGTAGHCDLL